MLGRKEYVGRKREDTQVPRREVWRGIGTMCGHLTQASCHGKETGGVPQAGMWQGHLCHEEDCPVVLRKEPE